MSSTDITTVTGVLVGPLMPVSASIVVPFPGAPAGKWLVMADVTPTGETNLHRSARTVTAK